MSNTQQTGNTSGNTNRNSSKRITRMRMLNAYHTYTMWETKLCFTKAQKTSMSNHTVDHTPYCKSTQMEQFAFKLAQSLTHSTFVGLTLIKRLQTSFVGESATCDKAEEIEVLIICSTDSVLVNTIQL
jgi:hypothetical protein